MTLFLMFMNDITMGKALCGMSLDDGQISVMDAAEQSRWFIMHAILVLVKTTYPLTVLHLVKSASGCFYQIYSSHLMLPCRLYIRIDGLDIPL